MAKKSKLDTYTHPAPLLFFIVIMTVAVFTGSYLNTRQLNIGKSGASFTESNATKTDGDYCMESVRSNGYPNATPDEMLWRPGETDCGDANFIFVTGSIKRSGSPNFQKSIKGACCVYK